VNFFAWLFFSILPNFIANKNVFCPAKIHQLVTQPRKDWPKISAHPKSPFPLLSKMN
jgi:hypothetical protein